jgi:hypothetical protein
MFTDPTSLKLSEDGTHLKHRPVRWLADVERLLVQIVTKGASAKVVTIPGAP